MKLVIYTALFADESLPIAEVGRFFPFTHEKDGVKYVAFANRKDLKSDFWEVRQVEVKEDYSCRMMSRFHKWKPDNKRLYHNMPHLLKTKGTERGLRALVNCFGTPESALSIKQFGGNVIEKDPTSVDSFDQNGYHLTKAEQCFLNYNGYDKVERRHEDCVKMMQTKATSLGAACTRH